MVVVYKNINYIIAYFFRMSSVFSEERERLKRENEKRNSEKRKSGFERGVLKEYLAGKRLELEEVALE